MKKQILMSLVLLVTGLVTGANAQTSSRPELRANIPFAFNVGQTSLPAGQYTLTVVNPSSDRKVLRVSSADGRLNAMVQIATNDTEHNNARLLFNRYGDQYVFAVAELAGESTSFTALKTKSERQMQRQYDKPTKRSDIVAVNAR